MSWRVPSRVGGFTLVELLVVLAILALVASVVPWAMDRWQASAEYRNLIQAVESGLLRARSTALALRQPTGYVFDLQRRRFGSWRDGLPEPRWEGSWTDRLQVELVVAKDALPGSEVGFLFMPDGGGTGGMVRVWRAPGVGAAVRVDWLTGAIQVLPGELVHGDR